MIRTLDPSLLNSIANLESVRPDIGGEGPVDVGGLMENADNIALVGDHGGFIFVKHEPGRYEVHTLIAPEGRGAAAAELSREAQRYLFTKTDCMEIITKVPVYNRPAVGFAKFLGFREVFRCQAAWTNPVCDVVYLSLTFDTWLAADKVALETGHQFHDRLEAAKAAAGSKSDIHADDDAHDRAAGATYLMIKSGNVRKGVWTYNRWAAFAGYATIACVSEAPLLVDIRDALVSLKDGEMEIVQCR